MSEKARDFVKTAIAGAVGFAFGGPAGALSAAFLVGNAAITNRYQKRAQAAAIQDRKFTSRGSASPMQIVLGRTRVHAVQLAPGWTHGPHSEYWTVPLGFAGVEDGDPVWRLE